MRKKRNLPISVLLLSFLMPSCSKSETFVNTEKTILHKQVEATSLMNLSSVKEMNDIFRYEDAVLFVSKPGCHYCDELRPYLDEYIRKTNSVIYEISSPYYLEALNSEENERGSYAYLYPKIAGTPSLLFYKNGKLQNTHTGSFGDTYEEFEKNFSSYVMEANIYYTNDFEALNSGSETYLHYTIDEDHLYLANTDTLLSETITKENDITVLYTWKRCKDCKQYREEILYPYLQEHPDSRIYAYELDGFFQKKRMEEESIGKEGLEEWSSFSEKYGLYTEDYFYTDRYGNKAGVAPCLVNYKNQEKTLSVYLNDFQVKRNEDGTLSYQMAFYPEVKALCSKTKVEEGDSVSDTYRKALNELVSQATKIENEKAKEFLEACLG